MNTRLFVYSGDCSSLELVISDDDSCPLGEGLQLYASNASFLAVAGTRYYFEWDNRWSESPFDFEFIFVPNVGNCAVSNNSDTGEGSLRNAIDCASEGDTIYISSLLNGDSICLESGKLVIDKNLTIYGNPNYDIPIDGTPTAQSIEISMGSSVVLQDIHLLVNPQSGMNAFDNLGDLILKNVKIEYLSSSTGGIFSNEGTLQMDPQVEIVEIFE